MFCEEFNKIVMNKRITILEKLSKKYKISKHFHEMEYFYDIFK